MRTDDKRKITSPENARHSTGPKTAAGKQRASMNALKHGAYSRKILYPGEDEEALHSLLAAHLHLFGPQNEVEETIVLKMTYTLWRSLRQAPAQASLVAIQMLRMAPAVKAEFESLNPEDLHALAAASLGHHGPHHLTREEVRLTRQYDNLRKQFSEIRAITPPDLPGGEPQPEETTTSSENAETNLTPGPQPAPHFNPHAEIFSFLPPYFTRHPRKEAPPSPPASALAAH